MIISYNVSFSLLAQRLMMLVAWCPFFCFHASHSNIQNYLSPWKLYLRKKQNMSSDFGRKYPETGVVHQSFTDFYLSQKITICHLRMRILAWLKFCNWEALHGRHVPHPDSVTAIRKDDSWQCKHRWQFCWQHLTGDAN